MKIQLSDHFTYKKLMKFSSPVIISMIISSLFGSVDDGLFVSNFAGKEAFTAINLVIPYIFILTAFGFMLATGGSALVSKLLGEGEQEKANKVFSILIEVLIILSVSFGAISFVFMEPIAIILGADEALLDYCVIYGRIHMLILPFEFFWYFAQSFLVVAEKPKAVFRITLAVSISNTLLDFVLIYVLRMGVVGASIATGTGVFLGGLISMLIFLFSKNSRLKFSFTRLEFDPIKTSVSNGLGEMVTNVSMNIICVLYNLELLKYYGDSGVVVYSITMYVGFIFIGIFSGYAMAIAPIISYNYGAKNHLELQNVVRKSVKLLLTLTILLTVVALLTAKPLSMIFVSYDKELLSFSIKVLWIFSFSYIFKCINNFSYNLFAALNNGRNSAIISFYRMCLFQLIFMYSLPIIFGKEGIWFATLLAELTTSLVSIYLVLKNKKKYNY